jgi:hypothetical protein
VDRGFFDLLCLQEIKTIKNKNKENDARWARQKCSVKVTPLLQEQLLLADIPLKCLLSAIAEWPTLNHFNPLTTWKKGSIYFLPYMYTVVFLSYESNVKKKREFVSNPVLFNINLPVSRFENDI